MTEENILVGLIKEYWGFDEDYSQDLTRNIMTFIDNQILRENIITTPLIFNCYPLCKDYTDLVTALADDDTLYESAEEHNSYINQLESMKMEELKVFLEEGGWRVSDNVAVGFQCL